MYTLDKINELIEAKGISQKDLADYLGMNKNLISEWNSGKSKSFMQKLPQIAEYFNVSVDYLLGNEQRALTKDEIKFALFDDADVDDAVLNDVLQYAKIRKEMNKQKKE